MLCYLWDKKEREFIFITHFLRLIYFLKFILRKIQRASGGGAEREGERERERERNRERIPSRLHAQHRAQLEAGTHKLQDHDLNQNQESDA